MYHLLKSINAMHINEQDGLKSGGAVKLYSFSVERLPVHRCMHPVFLDVLLNGPVNSKQHDYSYRFPEH